MTRLSREMPQMPPEQQAEMAAQMQAGALGPQHELMATQVGTHDVAIKSWMDPSAPPVESQGLATRTVHMGGGVLHEKFLGDMMGTPFTKGWAGGLGWGGLGSDLGKHMKLRRKKVGNARLSDLDL